MASTVKEFESMVVRETAYGPMTNYGMRKCKMELKHIKSQFSIEWEVFDENGEVIDYVEIGVWVEGKKVVDVDGVFELPKEAVALLKENGFDTSEVE